MTLGSRSLCRDRGDPLRGGIVCPTVCLTECKQVEVVPTLPWGHSPDVDGVEVPR